MVTSFICKNKINNNKELGVERRKSKMIYSARIECLDKT